MNEDTALSVSVVHACVAALANDLSTLPLRAYKRTKDRTKTEVDPPAVVHNPWPEGTLQDWLTQAMISLTLRGNFFGRICDRDADNYPVTIKPLHPDDVTARRNPKSGKREYRYKGELMPLADVFHIPAILLPGQFLGLDPIAYNAGSWGLAHAAERYGAAFFKNSAQPGGVIEVPEDLNEEETLELARAWSQRHAGLNMAQMPAVLTGGATWKQMTISPDNAQFLQARDFQRIEIAGFFGIPLHRLGIQDRTTNVGTDAESAELWYVNNTLIGWLTRFESYFSDPSVTRRTISVRFDLDARMRANTITRYQAWTLGRNGGWLSSDDIRFKEDLPDLPKGIGKTYWGPLNYAPLDKLIDGTATAGMGAGGVVAGAGGPGGGAGNHPDAPAGGGAPTSGTPNPMTPQKSPGDTSFNSLDVGASLAALVNALRREQEINQSLADKPHPTVNVAAPTVNMRAPDVHVAAPEVHVAAAEVNVTTPTPEVRVENTVNPYVSLETKAPDVHITNRVDVPKPSTVKRTVERDRAGQIVSVTEVPDGD